MTTLLKKALETLGDMSDYNEQALLFCEKTHTQITSRLIGYKKHWTTDKEPRLCYEVTISKGNRSFSISYGGSIADTYKAFGLVEKCLYKMCIDDAELLKTNGDKVNRLVEKYSYNQIDLDAALAKAKIFIQKPSAYDVLTCLTKSDPGDLDSFASEFGYQNSVSEAVRVHTACVNEWQNVCRLFSDEEIELMQLIN